MMFGWLQPIKVMAQGGAWRLALLVRMFILVGFFIVDYRAATSTLWQSIFTYGAFAVITLTAMQFITLNHIESKRERARQK